jgi:hypothetical protein
MDDVMLASSLGLDDNDAPLGRRVRHRRLRVCPHASRAAGWRSWCIKGSTFYFTLEVGEPRYDVGTALEIDLLPMLM